jgi:hypothetical protein
VPDVLSKRSVLRREDVMSGDLAPARRTSPEPAETVSEERPIRLSRLGYLLALLWVGVGIVLYGIEVAGLVSGRG